MRTRAGHHPGANAARLAFTLIELLVAIAIIAMLTGLVLSGVGKVRAVQMQRQTENTLSKLQLALDQQWKAVLDQVKEDKLKKRIPDAVVALADGDLDRAEAIWAYANLRREFPETVVEILPATGTITFSPVGSAPAYPLPPRATFAKLAGMSGTPDEQAALILHSVLTDTGHRGAIAAVDDSATAAQGSYTTTTGFTGQVFFDAWRMPITYRRFFGALNSLATPPVAGPLPELQAPPFVNLNNQVKVKVQNQYVTLVALDPLDPRGKLGLWPGNTVWSPQHRNAAQAALGVQFNVHHVAPLEYHSESKLVTVMSAGPNKHYENTLNTPNPGTFSTGDDLFGYRLHRQGSGGN